MKQAQISRAIPSQVMRNGNTIQPALAMLDIQKM